MVTKSKAIKALVVCAVIGIVLGLLIFFASMWYIGEYKSNNGKINVEIKTTVYKDGVPADEYANGFYSELLDEYSSFFKNTEFRDVYFTFDGSTAPKTPDGVYLKDGSINDSYYLTRTAFWQEMAHKYKKLISYNYTIGDGSFKDGTTKRYTGTAKVLAHDGTEHTEEFSVEINMIYNMVTN